MKTAGRSIVRCALVLITMGAASQQVHFNPSSKLTGKDTAPHGATDLRKDLRASSGVLLNEIKLGSRESNSHTAHNTAENPCCKGCSIESGRQGVERERGESAHAPDK